MDTVGYLNPLIFDTKAVRRSYDLPNVVPVRTSIAYADVAERHFRGLEKLEVGSCKCDLFVAAEKSFWQASRLPAFHSGWRELPEASRRPTPWTLPPADKPPISTLPILHQRPDGARHGL